MSNKLLSCSFCGAHKDIVPKLIVSDVVAICSNCVDMCNNLIVEENDEPTAQHSLDAQEIKEYLDKHVIGQDQAKIVLSVAIANHYKRLNKPSKDIEITKNNVLMLGPTGSGKTLLARTVAKFLNVPFVVADATSLTQAGYVGDDVESMITMLVSMADGDVELAERGIIFIDEIDKIARKGESTSITRDVSGEGVQQALLKLIEGTTCRISSNGTKRKNPNDQMIDVNTKNILFIAGGAFVGLEQIIKNRIKGSSIGFGAVVNTNADYTIDLVSPDDLTKFGMIPEFIGRFTTLVSLKELTKEQLIQVLTEVKNNFISQYKYIFSLDNIELEFTDQAIHQMVENCLLLKTGARGLHSEIEKALLPHMFYISRYKTAGVKSLLITDDMVKNPEQVSW